MLSRDCPKETLSVIPLPLAVYRRKTPLGSTDNHVVFSMFARRILKQNFKQDKTASEHCSVQEIINLISSWGLFELVLKKQKLKQDQTASKHGNMYP